MGINFSLNVTIHILQYAIYVHYLLNINKYNICSYYIFLLN